MDWSVEGGRMPVVEGGGEVRVHVDGAPGVTPHHSL